VFKELEEKVEAAQDTFEFFKKCLQQKPQVFEQKDSLVAPNPQSVDKKVEGVSKIYKLINGKSRVDKTKLRHFRVWN